jgi:hypothetical protein
MSDNTVSNLSECARSASTCVAELAPYANTNNIVDDSAQAKANTTSQEECDDFDTNLCQPLDVFGSPGKPLMLPPMLQRSASSVVHAPPMLQRSASSVVHAPPMLQRSASSVVHAPPMLQRSASSVVHAPPMLQRSASSAVQSNGPDCCGSDQLNGLECGISTRDRSGSVMDEDPLNIFKFGTPHSLARSDSGSHVTDELSEQDDAPYGSA